MDRLLARVKTRVARGLVAVLVATAAAAGCQARTPPRPNVVLIVVDTLRADHLGAYGYDKPTSPHIDALAQRGARFASAHSTASWTLPSVTSILTGLYPASHGVQRNVSVLSEDIRALPQAFEEAGYETVAVSANLAFVTPATGLGRGFQRFDVLPSPPPTNPPAADQMVGDPQFKSFVRVPTADKVTDGALDWLRNRTEGQKPFFLYLHYFDPHGGYFPPPEYALRFGVTSDEPLAGRAQWAIWRKHTTKNAVSPKEMDVLKALYDGEIAFTDDQIGRFLDAFRTINGEHSFLIVFTSDHGEEFGDHGGLQHGQTLWEEALHVPLIVEGTGVPPAEVIEPPVSLVSLWATLASLMDIKPPPRSEGPSLASFLRGPTSTKALPIFADLDAVYPGYRQIHSHALIQDQWKLLRPLNRGASQLYDLRNDPTEQQDIISLEPERASLFEALNRTRVRSVAMRAEKASTTRALSAEQRERLKALGYVDAQAGEGAKQATPTPPSNVPPIE